MSSCSRRSRSLCGQTVLVTGASSGIGAACARAFAEEGCNLVLVARRVDRLETLREELVALAPTLENESSISVSIVPADLSDESECLSLPDRVREAGVEAIDILINNAGLAKGLDTVAESSVSDIDAMFDVNVRALILLCRGFVSDMIKRDRGHIINIGSIAGYDTYPNGAVYCATKYAVRAFTEALQKELISTAVNVSLIAPGLVQTEFFDVRLNGDKERVEKIYAGECYITAEDVADSILFVATRPRRVQIANLTLYSTRQAGSRYVDRETGPVSDE